jgi:hypothetical protein
MKTAIILAMPRQIRLIHNPRFVQLLEQARQRVRVTGGVSLAEFRRRLKQRTRQVKALQEEA